MMPPGIGLPDKTQDSSIFFFFTKNTFKSIHCLSEMQIEWGILYLFAKSGNPNLGTSLQSTTSFSSSCFELYFEGEHKLRQALTSKERSAKETEWPGSQEETRESDGLEAKWTLFQGGVLIICQDLSVMPGSARMFRIFMAYLSSSHTAPRDR